MLQTEPRKTADELPQIPLTDAFDKAGGKGQVARICGVTWQSVDRWEKAGKLPDSEWTGATDYARRMCIQAELLGNEMHPLQICRDAGPYMRPREKEAA